jgi:hypothetical protein
MAGGFILLGAGPASRRVFELTGAEYLLDEQEAVSLLDRFTGTTTDTVARVAVADRGVHV